MSFGVEIVITVVYWPFIHPDLWPQTTQYKWSRKASLVLDHMVPLILLSIEYFMNNQPFIKRHCALVFILGGSYQIINFIYSVSGYAPYDFTDWKTVMGVLIPIIMSFVVVALWFFLEWCTRKKLLFTSV